MQKIIPHLCYDKESGEAAALYTSVFPGSMIKKSFTLHNTPSGSVEVLTIGLMGHEFVLFSAGPYFKFTPAVSFLVACRTKAEVDALWEKLSDQGTVLMEIGAYPFSERYGWVQDKFGLSWQVMFAGEREIKQSITPTLLFVGNQCGKAEEAINLYTSVFNNAKAGDIARYGKGEEPDQPGTVKHATFTLEGQGFAAMDSALDHAFTFTEAISFLVHCESQQEVDYYWEKLSADPGAEQCGWLKDKFGLSWQIFPTVLHEMLEDDDPEKSARVTQAFLNMKKLIIKDLQQAYERG